jgi:CheY-like chemotaxis protein
MADGFAKRAALSLRAQHCMIEPEQAATPIPDPGPSRARLLLAEDDFELRDLLAYVLRADGHEVIEAKDGSELWRLLDSQADQGFALVVSDVRMPGLTALEVLARLQHASRDTPIILITAFGDQTTHQRAIRLGARRVLDKPFDCDELREAVQETLQEHARCA